MTSRRATDILVDMATGTYTQTGLGKKLGVTRQAIGAAIKKGKLVLDENGRIDPDNPQNQDYIEFRGTAVKADSPDGRGRAVSYGAGHGAEGTDIRRQGKYLDNRLKAVKLAKERLKYAEDIKQVVPVAVVARSLSAIASLLNENFRSFDERNADELFEMAGVGKREMAEAISRMVNESMQAVMHGVQVEIENLVQESPGSNPNA